MSATRDGRGRAVLGTVLRTPTGAFGVAVVSILVAASVIGAVWTPFDPQATDPEHAWLLPFQGGHLLGTDRVGRDQFSLLVAAARQTLAVAVGTAVFSGILGGTLALIVALTPRPLAAAVVQLIDVVIAIPTILLAMVLTAMYGPSTTIVIVALGVSFSVVVSRVVRAELAGALAADYVLAARAAGARTARIIRRHALPAVAPTLVVQLSLVAALAVLAEAALSYLGYGASPSTPSWGGILHEQQAYITARPMLVVWPGLAVALTVLGLNLLGDSIRDAIDPRGTHTR
ncbi:MAG: ABC transporter permease [Gordonia sp. (in: high G+C Gram-positive bacteria)]